MGNIFSNTYSVVTQEEQQKLIQRLEKLDKIDLDNNGVISKEEFETWKATDLEIIKKSIKEDLQKENAELVHKYKKKEKEHELQINNMSEDLSTLKARNNQLEIELKEKTRMLRELDIKHIMNESSKITVDNTKMNNLDDMLDLITQRQIDIYVDDLLKNEKYNNPWIPDFAERPLKASILKLAFRLMKKILASASIEFVNHKLSLTLVPKSDKSE